MIALRKRLHAVPYGIPSCSLRFSLATGQCYHQLSVISGNRRAPARNPMSELVCCLGVLCLPEVHSPGGLLRDLNPLLRGRNLVVFPGNRIAPAQTTMSKLCVVRACCALRSAPFRVRRQKQRVPPGMDSNHVSADNRTAPARTTCLGEARPMNQTATPRPMNVSMRCSRACCAIRRGAMVSSPPRQGNRTTPALEQGST